jgi:glycine cleavage system regulatory protein
LEKLYFNQDGIKRSGVAQVCKFFRSKHVNVASLLPELRPIKMRADDARLHGAVNSSPKKYIAARVEDANLIAVCDSARAGIAGIHLE